MKKLMMAAALAVASLGASAQVYVGGGLSVHSYDNKYTTFNVDDEGVDVKEKSSVKFLPEVGYWLNDKMAIGVQFGISTDSYDSEYIDGSSTFSIQPYFRYKFFQSGNFSFFGDGTIGYATSSLSYKGDGDDPKLNTWAIGVRPGISYAISDHFSLVSTIGWLGYTSSKYDYEGAKAATDFGLDLSGESITFSLYYNF